MEINGRDIVNRIVSIGEIKEYVQVLHIPAQTISNWKTRNSFPKVDDLYRIAEYKHVSLDWLVTGTDENGIMDDERALLTDFNDISESERQFIRQQIHDAAERGRKAQQDKVNTAG
jgi:Bacteriophage CI repressor helix-turn-helix domain.